MKPHQLRRESIEDDNDQISAIDEVLNHVDLSPQGRERLKRERRGLEVSLDDFGQPRREGEPESAIPTTDPLRTTDALLPIRIKPSRNHNTVFGDDDDLNILRGVVTSLRSRGDHKNADALARICSAVARRAGCQHR